VRAPLPLSPPPAARLAGSGQQRNRTISRLAASDVSAGDLPMAGACGRRPPPGRSPLGRAKPESRAAFAPAAERLRIAQPVFDLTGGGGALPSPAGERRPTRPTRPTCPTC
jgi:hypothetical protein